MKKIIRITTVSSTFRLLSGQMNFLSQEYDVICVSSNGPHLEELEKKEGVRTYGIQMHRGISPIKDLVSIYKLYKVFKKERPWTIHSMTPKAGLISMVAGFFARVPNRIHTFTGLLFPTAVGLKKIILLTTDKITCLFATHVIPEGLGVKKDLERHKVTSKKLDVLGFGNINGINLNFFNNSTDIINKSIEIRNELFIKETDFVFLFVGRIVGDKGINELAKAFSILNSEIQNTKLVLVGPLEKLSNPITKDTKALIEKNDSIFHVGYKADIRAYLALANVFVFPSYREGVPNAVIQASAMGLPSIVSNVNGCNEIIENNVNGLIIPSKDIHALKCAMQELLINRELLESLARESRQHIAARYEQGYVWQKVLEYYKNLE